MELDTCDPLNIFLNTSTGELECLPGVRVAPSGYSQLVPEVTVKPRGWWIKYALLGAVAFYLVKKR